MKYLIVVDVQNDFVDGALSTKEAVEMFPRLLKKIKSFEGDVFMTKDTHPKNYLEIQEGKLLPVEHCIRQTKGWEFPEALDELREQLSTVVYEKPTFGSTSLAEDLRQLHQMGKVDSVEVVGICTDICVVSNALLLKAAMPEVPICVDASCCTGVTPEKHNEALDIMESCQILVKR